MHTSITKRQRAPEFEVNAMNFTMSIEEFENNLLETYGANPIAVGYLTREVGFDSRGEFVNTRDYLDFLKAFFPLVRENDTRARKGYRIDELGEIFSSPWWKGDMSASDFDDVLARNLNTAFARRSASDRSAFVLGFDTGDGTGPHIKEYKQQGSKIVVPWSSSVRISSSWGSLLSFYKAWAEAQGIKTLSSAIVFSREDQSLPKQKPSMLERLDELREKRKLNRSRRPGHGLMSGTIGASTGTNELFSYREPIRGKEPERDMSQWLG